MSTVCDFCGLTSPTWEYPAKDFTTIAVHEQSRMMLVGDMKDEDIEEAGATPIAGSEGSWLACDTCHGMIEADDYTALLKRCLNSFWIKSGGRMPDIETEITASLAGLHLGFQQNRTGEARWLATEKK